MLSKKRNGQIVELYVEEVEGLLQGREVEILEGIKIKLPKCIEIARIVDILDRYNNEEYWKPEDKYDE